MTREEIYSLCEQSLNKTNSLFMELATGTGKTKLSIDLVNHLLEPLQDKAVNILILVAKTVHKQTWKEEIEKWGGIHHPNLNICMECYESLKNHCREHWSIILCDEVHHIGSDVRLDLLKTMSFDWLIGLSATIPRKLKQYFRFMYHTEVVSCDLIEAIEDDILPEPEILLYPLLLDNTKVTETIVVNPKATKGPVDGEYKFMRKYKFQMRDTKVNVHCTQQQKLNELDSQITWLKNKYMNTHSKANEQSWLYMCGRRLEFLADCKLKVVQIILDKLKNYRTITFCKTIKQTEALSGNCIHSKKKDASEVYEKFNQKKIKHITAVNILNENANLVDCKYAIFANLSSSEVVMPQRLGRSMRHPHPVIIIPFYKGTREEEIVGKYVEGFNKDYIKVIHSITEI